MFFVRVTGGAEARLQHGLLQIRQMRSRIQGSAGKRTNLKTRHCEDRRHAAFRLGNLENSVVPDEETDYFAGGCCRNLQRSLTAFFSLMGVEPKTTVAFLYSV